MKKKDLELGGKPHYLSFPVAKCKTKYLGSGPRFSEHLSLLIMRRRAVGGVRAPASAGEEYIPLLRVRGGVSVISKVSLMCKMQLLSLGGIRLRVIGRSMLPSLGTLVRRGVRLR